MSKKAVIFLFCLVINLTQGVAEETAVKPEESSTKSGRPFITFNQGIASSWVTRIIRQEGRSNFVFSDFMPGLYAAIKTENMQPLNSIIRLAAYYPLTFKFNKVPQNPVNVLRFAVDLFAGITIELNMWDYVRIDLAPGLHAFFQNADRWNYFHLGVAGLAGVELPISKHWTILVNGLASFDYGNFGSNADIEPLNIVYQYQLEVGFRYSKRAENTHYYIKTKNQ